MRETELHDLSDDADYAASMHQGDAGKRSGSNEPSGSEVVYVKENVTIHPTQYASERISGRLRLIKQGSSLFMTWIPYKPSNTGSMQSSSSRLTEKDRSLYAIRAVPLTDVRSIRRHTPTLGWQYIIVVLTTGLAFPPLYFYNGGVREFLATLKEHVVLVRSADDANVFLVNDLEDPLQRSLSSLELSRAVPVVNGTSSRLLPSRVPSTEGSERISGDANDATSSLSEYDRRHKQKTHDSARDISIQVLEKFSLVTKFARETTSHLFRDNHSDGYGSYDRKHQTVPINVPSRASDDSQKDLDEISVTTDAEENSNSRKEKHGEAVTRVGTFEVVDCKEVFLIERHAHDQSYGMRCLVDGFHNFSYGGIAFLAFKLYWELDFGQFDKLSLVWGKPRQPPLGFEEWATFFDSEGRIMDSKALRKRVFYGGVEHSLRKEVWKFLLGFHAYDSTYAEREYLDSIKKSEYETIKSQWQSISPAQAKQFAKFRERKGLIDKDVVRTDRSISFYEGDGNPNVMLLRDILLTYSFYNFDLGYCQGMSDLLSPILFVMEDESESFWCFVALMERLGPNFNRDQSGMHSQLFALSKLVELLDRPLHNYLKQADCLNYFFCFRWILIQFKREFEFEKTMVLWEVLWTHYLSEHLHLYICIAILKMYRTKIIGEQMDFDTLLKFINELSGCIDLDRALRDAEALCLCAGENGASYIPPGTPPSLPIETGLVNSDNLSI